MAGQSGKRGRFFSRRGLTLPLCTGAFLQRGGPIFSPNPAGNGKHKSSHRRKKVGVVFIKAEPIDKAGGKKTGKRLEGASCTLPQLSGNEEAKVYAAACFPGGTFVPAGENFLLYWCPMCILIGRGDGHGRAQGENSHQQGRGQRRGPFQRLPGGAALCLDEEPGYHRERPGSAAAI